MVTKRVTERVTGFNPPENGPEEGPTAPKRKNPFHAGMPGGYMAAPSKEFHATLEANTNHGRALIRVKHMGNISKVYIDAIDGKTRLTTDFNHKEVKDLQTQSPLKQHIKDPVELKRVHDAIILSHLRYSKLSHLLPALVGR